MFRKAKKESSKGLNRFMKKIKKNDTSSKGQGGNGPQNANMNADSDYEDSHALDDSSTNAVEVYVDNEEDSTYQNQPRSALTQSDDGSHSGASTEKPKVPKPVVAATAVETITPSKPPAALTEEERKARARNAIEERKKKSRADIAARRARAAGIAVPPVAVAVSVVTPEKEKNIEERLRLVEQERREEEEAELKKLEEDLLREEEEAKAEAGKMAEKLETIQKEEALENALKKEVKVVDKIEVETVIETIDSSELEEEEEAGRLMAEELAKFEAEMEENTKAERLRAKELAKFEAEMEEKSKTVNVEMNESQHEKARKKAEDDALRALDQFITRSSDDVDDVYQDDSANDIDLDDLLGGSLSVNDSMTLDTAIDGPIVFTSPTSKSVDKKTVAPKPKIPSKPAPRSSSKANVRKPTANSLNSRPTPVGNKPNKKPSVSKPRRPAPTLASNTPNKKPSVWKPWKPKPTLAISKSNQKSSVSKPRKPAPTLAISKSNQKSSVVKPRKPAPTLASNTPNKKPSLSKPRKPAPTLASNKPNEKASMSKPCDISHLRPPRESPTPKGKRRITEAPSIDSMGSVCTVTSIPPSPFQFPLMENMPICNRQYIPKQKLHAEPGGCAVCIYKLSETEREKYEKNERHYLVAQTTGGCLGCNVFPSQPDEEPVRLCKKCFFDTHLLHVKPDEAFAGSGFLTGVQKTRFKYSPKLSRYASSRK